MKVKKISLEIETGNDAFQTDGAAQLRMIFEHCLPWAIYELATVASQRTVELKMRDMNGNYCAVLKIEREDDN